MTFGKKVSVSSATMSTARGWSAVPGVKPGVGIDVGATAVAARLCIAAGEADAAVLAGADGAVVVGGFAVAVATTADADAWAEACEGDGDGFLATQPIAKREQIANRDMRMRIPDLPLVRSAGAANAACDV